MKYFYMFGLFELFIRLIFVGLQEYKSYAISLQKLSFFFFSSFDNIYPDVYLVMDWHWISWDRLKKLNNVFLENY